MSNINEIPQGSLWYSYLNLNTKNFDFFNENSKSVTLTQGHARGGDGADKNLTYIYHHAKYERNPSKGLQNMRSYKL